MCSAYLDTNTKVLINPDKKSGTYKLFPKAFNAFKKPIHQRKNLLYLSQSLYRSPFKVLSDIFSLNTPKVLPVTRKRSIVETAMQTYLTNTVSLFLEPSFFESYIFPINADTKKTRNSSVLLSVYPQDKTQYCKRSRFWWSIDH